MSDMARKKPSLPDLLGPREDEGSAIRAREGAASTRPRADSSSEVRADAAPPTKRHHSSTRPATGSLDDRLEKKMRLAGELMRDLPSTDSRVRLLYIAIMRRDEALVDGVLAELNKTPRSG
jgi:hypothetical protein